MTKKTQQTEIPQTAEPTTLSDAAAQEATSEQAKFRRAFKKPLDCALTDQELLERSRKLSELLHQADVIRAERAGAMAAFKRRLGAVEEEQAKALRAIDTGVEERPVDVREYYDHRTGRVCYVRQDTFHAEVRPMDDSERQVDLEAQRARLDAAADEATGEQEYP